MKQCSWIVCAVLAMLVMLGCASDAAGPGLRLDAPDAGGLFAGSGELAGRGAASAGETSSAATTSRPLLR